MFNCISPRYDFLNRVFSLGIDLHWRKKLSKACALKAPFDYLDIACGTGDQLLSMHREHKSLLKKIVGLDIASEMLALARKKLPQKIELFHESALAMPFADQSFDVITISFGIRNLPDLSRGLKEMKRVLKPGGKLLILEFSLPSNKILRALHLFYLRTLMPRIGGWFSKHPKAYLYLNETIEEFPYGEDFCKLLQKEGFHETRWTPLTFGVASIYVSSTLLV